MLERAKFSDKENNFNYFSIRMKEQKNLTEELENLVFYKTIKRI
jgi:hypothetical protein